MKIVQVINQLRLGGAEKLVLELHQEFLKNGHTSFVIALCGTEVRGKNIFNLDLPSPNSLRAKSALKKILSSLGEVDVIHAHLTQSQFWVGRIKKHFPKTKFITTEHDTSNNRRHKWWGRFVDRFIYSPFDKIICISGGVKKSLENWLPVVRDKTIICYNGIRIEEGIRQRSFSKDKVRLITVGRLVKKKGIDLAIHALSEVPDSFSLTIIGDGEERASLKQLVKSLKVENRVRFVGFVENPNEYLMSSDVFLMPSRFEGFGLALVEAMSVGLPAIISNIPGISEVGRGEQDGCIMFESENVASLSQAILAFAQPDFAYDTFSKNAFARAQQFTIEKMASAYEGVYS